MLLLLLVEDWPLPACTVGIGFDIFLVFVAEVGDWSEPLEGFSDGDVEIDESLLGRGTGLLPRPVVPVLELEIGV